MEGRWGGSGTTPVTAKPASNRPATSVAPQRRRDRGGHAAQRLVDRRRLDQGRVEVQGIPSGGGSGHVVVGDRCNIKVGFFTPASPAHAPSAIAGFTDRATSRASPSE